MKKNLALAALFFLVFFAFSFHPATFQSQTAFAAEEHAAAESEGHAEGEGHGGGWLEVAGKWFNFLALAGILYWFLGKKLRIQDGFQKDYEQIQKSIESAKQAKEEAEARLQELDKKMLAMSDDIARIKADAAKEAEEEKKRILESAQREAERIVEFAHREIDGEVELARRQLRKQVADLSVEQGKKIIESEINDQDHQRLIRDYIEGFGK